MMQPMPTSASQLAASLAPLWPAPWHHPMSPSALVRFVSEALDAHRIFPSGEHIAKRVPQICVFVAHCAPRVAPQRGLELAAEFLFAFFALNDHWEQMRGLFDDDAPASPAVAFVRGWLDGLSRDFGPSSARFRAAFEVYLASLAQEKRYEAAPGHPTFDEYVDVQRGRYQWVATAPYIELWELALGVELSEAQRPAADELKRLAVELTYLANDIGSLARDPAAKNFVTLLARKRAELRDLDEALAATSRIYGEKAEALVAGRLRVTSEASLGRYAELVCDIADGNLRATTLLARRGAEGRYAPAARDILRALPSVGSAGSAHE